MKRAWSPAAEEKLRALYATTPLPRLAFLLKRTEKAIRSRAKVLGLVRREQAEWTAELDAQLSRLYPDHSGKQVADALGLSVSQVYNRAFLLGLRKSEAFHESDRSTRIKRGRTDPRMVASQIKPGSVPWNKGRHYVAGGRSAETRFRKGEMRGAAQHNYVPVGTRKIRDGLLCVKLHDTGPYPASRWHPVHRLVWEAAHGPVPAGHIVIFQIGRQTVIESEITADRLALVTRAENMRRNSRHTRYPPEVNEVIQLAGALKRKINNRRKQHGNA